MLSIKEIFYHVQAAAHINIPDQKPLQEKISELQERFDAAQNGIFISPMYKRQPFDKDSTRAKIYNKSLENSLNDAKMRLNIFYPPIAKTVTDDKQYTAENNVNNGQTKIIEP